MSGTKWGKRKSKPKIKEADVLKATREYLDWEHIPYIRASAGTARVGGQPIKLPEAIASQIRGYLFTKDIKPFLWDGFIRVAEQWLPLATKGTPDIVASIPAGRPAYNDILGEYETFPIARTAYIETKRSHGGKLSDEQADFAREARSQGALFFVIRDLDELRKAIPPKMELNFYGGKSA